MKTVEFIAVASMIIESGLIDDSGHKLKDVRGGEIITKLDADNHCKRIPYR